MSSYLYLTVHKCNLATVSVLAISQNKKVYIKSGTKESLKQKQFLKSGIKDPLNTNKKTSDQLGI